jgi:Kdo2-lipid IVA lauroyltransferase/acyltransferase
MAKTRSALRNLVEYGALRAVLALFRILPPRAVFWISDRAADLAYIFDSRHRKVAEENLSRVFAGEFDSERVKKTARGVFRSFFRVAAELALLPDMIEKRGLDEVISVTGEEHVRSAFAGGNGVIVYSAHLGNWEAIAAVGEPLGMKLHSVGRALDNPYLDRLLVRHRSRYARSIVPKENGLRRIVQLLRDGCGVAMLLDQHAGRDGIMVDFLGRPAATFRAPAEIAWKFGLPILGGFGIRIDGAPRFRLEFQEPLWPDRNQPRDEEVRRLTQAMSDRIGEYVRRYPDQWNWLHRRWREGKVAESHPHPSEASV